MLKSIQKSLGAGTRPLAAFALALMLPVAAHSGRGDLINIEEAAEVSELSLTVTSNNRARVYASICDQCPLLSLEVTDKTVITRGRQRLTLEEAELLNKLGATVLFEPATLQVTRILYWQ